jgi:polyferredoxin
MRSAVPYALLADIVLTLHVAVVVFVVGGLVLVIAGNLRGWRWVNALWFRVAHLGAIVFVVAETWLGLVCPLTTLEWWLRSQAGMAVEGKSFIAYWLQRLLYYDAPWWVFAVSCSLFGLLVLASWVYFPPGGMPRRNAAEGKGNVN